MRKTFPLEHPKHKPARVIESVVNDIRKYLKRERRKKLPEGVDFWDFDCRVGSSSETAEVVHVSAIPEAIHKAPANEWTTVYVEILAKEAYRTKKPEPEVEVSNSNDLDAEEAEADSDSASDGEN